MILTIISWNANGLRTRRERGDLIALLRHNPEIVCFQETRVAPRDIIEMGEIHGYHGWFSPLFQERHNGVGMIARIRPDAVSFEIGDPRIDGRGRLMTADFRAFTLVNAYFPGHGAKSGKSIERLVFLDGLLDFLTCLNEQDRAAILCYSEDDIRNQEIPDSFDATAIPNERSWADQLDALGFSNAMQGNDGSPASESWHSAQGLLKQEQGVHHDYFFISGNLKSGVLSYSILDGIRGSSHYPISLDLEAQWSLP